MGERVGSKVALMARNKSALSLFILALIVGGISASATGLLNTASGGYLVCVDTKTKVVTHPGTSSCPKGSKKLVLGAQGATGAVGLTGAAGLSGKDGKDGKDGKTLWNGTTDPVITWGAPGDMYINSVTKTLFGPKDLTTGWPAGVSMVGPQGLTGPQGPRGVEGAPGAPGATGPAGINGTNGATGAAGVLTCATGGTCAIGDTGPGGGKVFIVKTATAAAPWRYMEAAPNTWSGGSEDVFMPWCSNTTEFVPNLQTGAKATVQTSAAIGAGYTNTQKMLRGCSHGAANAASSYNGGGKSDWHLPSKDELNQLYSQKATVGGFAESSYWSSFETSASGAWAHAFNNGGQIPDLGKQFNSYVRPVRAFG
jgi:hypothetical protein